jgi:transcriptional regulator with XRE-family HTH domain
VGVTINQAVRALRKQVKKTQQIFATELGISISALNNYERRRTPEPKQLLAFQRAAMDAGRYDLANVFRTEAAEALGWESSMYTGVPLDLSKLREDDPKDWYELTCRDALEDCLRLATDYKDIAPIVISALRLAVMVKASQLWWEKDSRIVERFTEESARRGFVPIVHGEPIWANEIPDIKGFVPGDEKEPFTRPIPVTKKRSKKK